MCCAYSADNHSNSLFIVSLYLDEIDFAFEMDCIWQEREPPLAAPFWQQRTMTALTILAFTGR